MRELELLSPAKNLEQGIAAIDHGADAVYIGPPQFGARAAAGNSLDDIAQLCRYAHQFGARVYATVNTLLHDDELPQATQLMEQLAQAQVDAVLIQDLRLLQQKSLPIHASTQADNRTPEKVCWLWEQGVRRTVLARELNVSQVAAIHQAVPEMELEVFVHGALCVSYSGLCYASEHCFGRSANRGECAQFCRMKFDLLDADGRELIHQRHLLSLKDLNLSQQLGLLIEAGATSFKIEGRLKDMAYVKNVTAAYSQLLDRYIHEHPGQYRRASLGRCKYTFTPDLNRTFHRGYTTYFAVDRQPHIASFDTPKALGQAVGRVKSADQRSLVVAGTAAFVNGDGLCYFDADRQLQGFRVNRAEGNRLFPLQMPRGLRPGTMLFRNSDQAMERELSRASAERRIPVIMSLRATQEGYELTVQAQDNTNTPTAFLGQASLTMEHQQAMTPQRLNIIRELSKLGGTPYKCVGVDIPEDFPYFIPASKLAELRRKVASPPAPLPRRGEHSDLLAVEKKKLSIPLSLGEGQGVRPLMQCRYCLRYELGTCHQDSAKESTLRDPLYLRLADGRRFRLQFDCRRCQMNVLAADED